MEKIKTIESYYKHYEDFLAVIVWLNKCFHKMSNLTELEDQETIERFFHEDSTECSSFSEVYDATEDSEIVQGYNDFVRKKNLY